MGTRSTKAFINLALATALLACPSALAHDFWFQSDGNSHQLLHGHPPGFPEGESRMKYGANEVKQVRCLDMKGAARPAAFSRHYPLRIEGDCAAIVAELSTGPWTKTPYGTQNLPKSKARNALTSWIEFENVKKLSRWSERFSEPLAGTLELVPLKNPFPLKEGSELELKVTLQGRPAAGAAITCSGKPCGKSDTEGRVRISIQPGRHQLVEADFKRELPASLEADQERHRAFLDFRLATDQEPAK